MILAEFADVLRRKYPVSLIHDDYLVDLMWYFDTFWYEKDQWPPEK